MCLRVPALSSIRRLCLCNGYKCLLLFVVLGWHGNVCEDLQLGEENQYIFILLGRLDKMQEPPGHWLPHSPPSSVLHPSPCPCITASRGPYFLPSSESRTGPEFVTTSWKVCSSGGRQRLRPPGNGAMHRGRFTAPFPFRHFIWCDAELTAPHFQVLQTPLPPQEPVWAVWGPASWVPPKTASLQWSWQTGTGSRRAAFQNPLLLAGPRSGTYSIFTTQWYAANVFLPRRQKYVSSSYSLSLWKNSVVRKETLSVYMCIFRGGENRGFVHLSSSWKSAL